MGTNFYAHRVDQNIENHIGKRSAAGPFCWTCGITLCRQGNSEIHTGDNDWYDACPQCGEKLSDEPLEESTTGRELGFNKNKPRKKSGVRSCSSFTWAIDPVEWKLIRNDLASILSSLDKESRTKTGWVIEDEYGRRFSIQEFQEVLLECPVQFFDSIGREFS